jgi:putative intracellular protease/amidase
LNALKDEGWEIASKRGRYGGYYLASHSKYHRLMPIIGLTQEEQLALYLAKNELVANKVTSLEGFQVSPHTTVDQVDIDTVDLFVIPGGNTPSVLGHNSIVELIQSMNQKRKVIGAICHGPVLLAEAGVLENKKYTSNVTENESSYKLFQKEYFVDTDIVKDGNIITAKGNAYVEFAMEIGKVLNAFDDKSTENWYWTFLKNTSA